MIYLIALSTLLTALIVSVASKKHNLDQHSVHSHGNSSLIKDHSHRMAIDKGIAYGVIMPFSDEWKSFFHDVKDLPNPSPFQMWIRCVGHEARGYLFFEDLVLKQQHNKEAIMVGAREFQPKVKLTADGQPVFYRSLDAGADFFFNISTTLPPEHNIDIMLDGFKHFVRFPISMCSRPIVADRTTKHVMHIHLRDFSNKRNFNPVVIEGVANHLAYHRCALRLDKYEVAIQRDFAPLFEANPKIAHAINEGWLTLLIRNPMIPSPIKFHGDSNCYYQAYVQNMAILQHWKQNVRLYFFDTDEYLGFYDGMTPAEYMKMVFSHTNVGFRRYMVYKDTSAPGEPDFKDLSLSQSVIAVNSHILRDEKIVVDPNRVGCVIVHWAQCGDEVKVQPIEKAYIMHFENLYSARWSREARNDIGKEYKFNVTPVAKKCDPYLYDWKSPLPSFHH